MQGVRDPAVELMHALVTVHAEVYSLPIPTSYLFLLLNVAWRNMLLLFTYGFYKVFAGCEPLLDKTLGILVEGLIDTLLSLFHEHKDTNLKILDANGYCQLMLEVNQLYECNHCFNFHST